MHKLDWIEDVHHFLYHFFRGRTYDDQYVGTVMMGEEALEEVFHDLGLQRNMFAYWKMTEGGRDSEGSWRMTYDSHPSFVEPGMQLHITVFDSKFVDNGMDIYCHYEDDYTWSIGAAIRHLNETNFDASEGVSRFRSFFLQHSNVHLFNKHAYN